MFERQLDPIAASQRQAEIAKVMARVEDQKQRLLHLLSVRALTQADISAARALNESTNPILAEHWRQFMSYDLPAQQAALQEPRHNGMHWQSLMQCNPFVITSAWRNAA